MLLNNLLLLLFSSLAYSAPLIITSMGGLFSERAGVVNIALEGLMLIGALGAALTATYLGSYIPTEYLFIVCLLVSGIVGGIFSLLHAVASINFKADQIISGTALNMLSLSLCTFLVKILFSAGETPGSSGVYIFNIPVLQYSLDIGFIISVIVFLFTNFIFYKTVLGLRLRASGENPYALNAAGISVEKIRYFSIIMSGVLSGIGGGLVVLVFSGAKFQSTITSGLGFLAIAALIFGRWKPINTFLSCLFFGFCQSFSNTALSYFPSIALYFPSFILKIIPYLFTLLALVFVSSKSNPPKFIGKIFDKNSRY